MEAILSFQDGRHFEIGWRTIMFFEYLSAFKKRIFLYYEGKSILIVSTTGFKPTGFWPVVVKFWNLLI